MLWKIDQDAELKWAGQCQDCKWFSSDDDIEPCSICKGTDSHHNQCYFNATLIEPSEMERTTEAFLDGIKDKAGKPQMRLILPRAAEALVRVREYGLKKYPDAENWRKVPQADWLDALMRHMMKYIGGEVTDRESGLPHLWHALCNLSYMIEGEQNE